MAKPIENFIRDYGSQTEDMPGRSQQTEKTLQRLVVLWFFLYIWNQRRKHKED